MAKKAKKGPGIWAEFKEFINRGNAFMLAVGVVIGGAFGAIVNAFVNMLMSLATWPVPGGLSGLVTVLPALTDGQKGLGGVGQKFAAADYNAIATQIGTAAGAQDPALYGATIIGANYTKYGTNFYFKGSAIINWGALINAIISFVIIAVVCFCIGLLMVGVSIVVRIIICVCIGLFIISRITTVITVVIIIVIIASFIQCLISGVSAACIAIIFVVNFVPV